MKLLKNVKFEIAMVIVIAVTLLSYTGYTEYKNITFNQRVSKLQKEIVTINKSISQMKIEKVNLEKELNIDNQELEDLRANLIKAETDLDDANKRLQSLN